MRTGFRPHVQSERVLGLTGIRRVVHVSGCDIVAALELPQPSVSQHLKVLRDVGLVHERREGRQVFYRTDAGAIRPLYEWTRTLRI